MSLLEHQAALWDSLWREMLDIVKEAAAPWEERWAVELTAYAVEATAHDGFAFLADETWWNPLPLLVPPWGEKEIIRHSSAQWTGGRLTAIEQRPQRLRAPFAAGALITFPQDVQAAAFDVTVRPCGLHRPIHSLRRMIAGKPTAGFRRVTFFEYREGSTWHSSSLCEFTDSLGQAES